MRVMQAGFLMCCAAIHSSACRLNLAPVRVVLQRADSALGDGCVQVHVSAVESIGSVVEMSQRGPRIALEVRQPAFSSEAIGSDHAHPLAGDAPGCRARHGQESAANSMSLAAIASAQRARR